MSHRISFWRTHAQAASACNLFATRACQFTQAVQHWAMRRAAAEAVSNQQAVSKSSSSGPHYINRLSSTVLVFRQ